VVYFPHFPLNHKKLQLNNEFLILPQLNHKKVQLKIDLEMSIATGTFEEVEVHSSPTSDSHFDIENIPQCPTRYNDREKDDDILYNNLHDAGYTAFGVVAVEVWVLRDDKTKLFRPKKGFWMDKNYIGPGASNTASFLELNKQPRSLPIGYGLAGALWSEKENEGDSSSWRDLRVFADDPDQPYCCPRLELLLKLRIGLGCGVHFDIRGNQGIVIYLARLSADLNIILTEANKSFLCAATDAIGVSCTLRDARDARKRERSEWCYLTLKRKRQHITNCNSLNCLTSIMDDKITESDSQFDVYSSVIVKDSSGTMERTRIFGQKVRLKLKSKAKIWMIKSKGGAYQVPAGSSMKETLLIFVGCFVSLYAVIQLGNLVSEKYFLLGPFGAVVAMQFALTAAPSSQPRNMIFSQFFSIIISMLMRKTRLHMHILASFTTALTTALMAFSGLPHPPASAAALLFVSNKDLGWSHLGVFICCIILTILISTGLNNLSEKKQYPNYWLF